MFVNHEYSCTLYPMTYFDKKQAHKTKQTLQCIQEGRKEGYTLVYRQGREEKVIEEGD